MSKTKKLKAVKVPELTPEQNAKIQAALRNNLTTTAFNHYHTLVNYLKTLPIPQQAPGMSHAYLSIDTGMIWIKELLATMPIVLPEKKDK